MSKFFSLSGGQKTLSVFMSVVLSLVIVTAVTEAASTISTNIQTDGALTVLGASTFGDAADDINLFTGTLQASSTTLFSGTLTQFYNNVGFGATTSPIARVAIEQGTENNVFAVGDTGTTTPTLIVKGNAMVGINTYAPATALEVTGTASSSAVRVGGGTSMTRIQKGTCDMIISGAMTASTTSTVDCAVTGVISGDTIFYTLSNANVTTNALLGFHVLGANASTTSGFISFRVANNMGAAAVIPASFGSSTQYLIIR